MCPQFTPFYCDVVLNEGYEPEALSDSSKEVYFKLKALILERGSDEESNKEIIELLYHFVTNNVDESSPTITTAFMNKGLSFIINSDDVKKGDQGFDRIENLTL